MLPTRIDDASLLTIHLAEGAPPPMAGFARHEIEVDLINQRVDCDSSKCGVLSDTQRRAILSFVHDLRASRMAAACNEYDQMGLPDGEDTDADALDECYANHGVDDLLEVRVVIDLPAAQPTPTKLKPFRP